MVGGLLSLGGQTLKMPELYELRIGGDSSNSGSSRAVISTRGAALVGLTLDGTNVMPDCAGAQAQRYFAGSTLAPWPNRMAGASWSHNRKTLRHEANDGQGNANHGLVFDQEFSVIEQTGNSVTLRYAISPALANVYPFRVSIGVTYRLAEHSLTATLSATNESDEVIPVSLGSHPYFATPLGTTLELAAEQVGLDSKAMIPGRRGPVAEIGLVPGRAIEVTGLALDHEFSGFVTRHPRATLHQPNGVKLHIDQSPELGYQMVYVCEDFPWDAGAAPAIAIEPQSAAIDSFNNGLGLRELPPGATFSADWTASVER